MATYDAGRVVLTVWPSFAGVQERIGREAGKWGRDAGRAYQTGFNREVAAAPTVNPGPSDAEAARLGNDAGKAYGNGFRSGVGSGGPAPVPGPSPSQSRQQGQRSGGAYGDAFRAQLEQATRSLPRIELPMATTEAKQKIRDLRTDLERLSNQRIGIDVDAATAEAEVERLLGQLRALNAAATDVQVRADTAGAIAKLEGLQEQLRSLSGATVDVDLEVQDGSFAARIRQAIERAQAALPRIEIDADSSDAEVEIQRIRGRLDALGSRRIGVDISAADAAAQITRLQGRLERLQASTTDVRVNADAAAAAAALAAVQAQVDRLNGSSARVDVDSTSINTFSGRLVLLGTAIASIAPALLPIGGIAITSLGAIGAAATTAIPALATLVLGFKGVGEALKQMGKVQDESAGLADKNSEAAQQQAQAQAAAARQVESAEASLANTRANVAEAEQRTAQQIAQAQQGVIKAREDAARSAATAARQVLDAQAGLADAEEALAESVAAATKRVTDAREAAARSAEAAARRVADAERDLQDARQAADEAAVQDAKRVADAREALARVTTDGAQRVQTALRRQTDAERDYSDALRTERDLQRDLAQARKDAQDQLEDLSFRVRQGALDEKQAGLDLAEARAEYEKAQTDGKATDASREQARIRFEEAKLQLEQLEVSNQRLAEQQAEANEEGVEGSDAVASAQERIAAAVRAREDADRAAREAAAGVEAARVEAANAVADAEERLAEASSARLKGQEDGERRVSDAQRALADALGAQTQAQVNAAERITEAEAARMEAQEDGAERVAGAQQRAADAVAGAERTRLEGLERIAQAQDTVSQAVTAQAEQQRSAAFSLEQAERSLAGARESAATAAAGGAVAATAAMRNLDTAMGKLSPLQQEFTRFLFGLGPQLGVLQDASAAGLLPGVQRGIEALLPLMPTFERLALTFGTALGSLFERAGQSLAGPEFQRFYVFLETQGPGILSSLGTLVGSVFSVFNGLAEAFGPIAAQTITSLAGLTQRFADFLHTAGDNESFQDFLRYVQENTPAVMEFLGSLTDAFVNIIRSMAPFGPVVLGVIGFLADMIAAVPPGVLAAIALAVTGIVTAFTILGPVIAFVSTIIAGISAGLPVLAVIIAAFGGPVTLIVAGVVALGAAFLAAWHHSETFRNAIYGIGDVFVWLWEKASWLGNMLFDGILWPFRNPGVIWDGIKSGFFFLLEAIKEFFGIHSPSTVFAEIGEFLILGLLSAFEGLQKRVHAAFIVVKQALLDVWGIVVDKVWNPIQTFLTVTLPGYYTTAVSGIARAWEWVKDTVRKPLDWLRDNVFAPYFTFYTVTLPGWFTTAVGFIGTEWGKYAKKITDPIDWLRDNVWNVFANFLTVKVPGFVASGVNLIGTEWAKYAKKITDPIDWLRDNVWNVFANFVTVTLPGYFTTATDRIGAAWDMIKEKLKQPIRFVIDTVINQGIVDAFNWIAGKVGLPQDKQLQRFKLPEGFARGGVLAGQSSWRDGDDQLVPMRRGEGVAVSEAMQVPEAREQLLTWNRLGVQGGASAVRQYMRGMQGYARGGIVDLGRWFQGKGARVAEHPAFGGVSNVHRGRGHYEGRAIDVNRNGNNGSESDYEKEFFDRYANALKAAGWTVYWRVPGHFNHLHAEAPTRSFEGAFPDGGILSAIGDLAAGAWDFLSGLNPIDYLKGKVGELMGSVPGAGAALDLAKAVPNKLLDVAGSSIMSLLSSVNPFDGSENDTPSALGGTAAQNREVVRQRAALRGWGDGPQWAALDWLVNKESSYRNDVKNPTSTAYGLFQFLNGTWDDVGGRKTSDPGLQTDYGLRYIAQRYTDPIGAKRFHQKNGWYWGGGIIGQPEAHNLRPGPGKYIPALAALGLQPFGHLADVPAMAAGGVVRATPGGTIVRLAEAGRDEAVVDAGLLNARMRELEGLTSQQAVSFSAQQLAAMAGTTRRQDQLAPLLRELIDLAGDGNAIAQSGLDRIYGAVEDGPRRHQQLTRQGGGR
ncbi:transglycosylase [Kineococcus radiotolerans]|uniref:Transglycosylase domain protein n=1 Tax=Kineococcus radiotolerans (strain ATCC BAA-149 / DSM 14245 / SRS30216) TaxID=266940 RepID=A6W8Q7_KINRD|nr:transglycosylase [Kineococcus radiotolerans]ABS03196.1 Transglycosylase domain protein [Kineococcus radiotolerans SRS30216 = ATCC BAA-149]